MEQRHLQNMLWFQRIELNMKCCTAQREVQASWWIASYIITVRYKNHRWWFLFWTFFFHPFLIYLFMSISFPLISGRFSVDAKKILKVWLSLNRVWNLPVIWKFGQADESPYGLPGRKAGPTEIVGHRPSPFWRRPTAFKISTVKYLCIIYTEKYPKLCNIDFQH